MRVAIAHDYLVNKGGAERVVLALHRLWPAAPVFTALYHPEATFEEFAHANVRPSALQRRSRSAESFRRFLPLFGRTFRRTRIEGFDVVVSSSAGFAHHVRPKDACHVVYCHTPPRFLWDERYDHASVAPRWARPLLPAVLGSLRRSDRKAAARAHLYVANSKRTAKEIERVYGRRSVVVHPPVEVDRYAIAPTTGDYYLMVGRLLAHRNMDRAVEAFTAAGRHLVVVGEGPARAALESKAGPTIEFRGAVDDATLASLYARCRGVVVPGVEDFGIVPLEANASGRPVIALGIGGVLETVKDGVTGVLFGEDTAASLNAAVERAEAIRFDPVALRAHAETFAERAFADRMARVVAGSASGCMECARSRRTGSGYEPGAPGMAGFPLPPRAAGEI